MEEIDDVSVTPSINESGKSPKTCGSRVQFSITASDPEADNLYYTIEEIRKDGDVVDSVEMMNLDDSTGDFSWCARTSQVGEYDIRFLVQDCRPVEEETDCSGNEIRRSMHATVLLPDICTGSGSDCSFLKAPEHADRSGNTGDFYLAGDNESDTSYHAVINVAPLPQLDFLDKLKGSDFSVNPAYSSRGFEGRVFDGKVVIGNSSTAYTSGTGWGGHVRKNCMSSQYNVDKVYKQYTANHHMWYPGHTDHDDKDQHFAKIPYCSASQGSSGSERDELEKFVRTLAAFKKPVKGRLRDEGLLIPVLQMIFRRTRVTSDGEYLSGDAHPNAFDNASNRDGMMAMAYGIDPETIPPFARIEVLGHTYNGSSGFDYFSRKSEVHFETPASVAFIFRGRDYTKQAILSARSSFDLNDRSLSYHWSVLRGASEHVRITPLAADASVVRVEIDYHPETTIEGSTRLTNNVEIGVFVHNGEYYSAPAFVTSHTLCSETREYQEGRLVQTTYGDAYVDPLVAGQEDWERDVFAYNLSGELTGWTRYLADSSTQQFDADGHCVGCVTHALNGRVAIQDTGMANMRVVASHYDGLEGPHTAFTDSNGYFTFPGLPDGRYYVEVENLPNGYRSSRRLFSVSTSDVSNADIGVSCTTGFVLEDGACIGRDTISGQVVLWGAGLSGVEVIGENDSGEVFRATTDSEGFFVLGVGRSGLYTVVPKSVDFEFDSDGWSNPFDVEKGHSGTSVTGRNFTASCTEWATDRRCATGPLGPRAPRSLRINNW